MASADVLLRERSLAGLARFQRLIGTHAAGARLLEGPGWVASVVPSLPHVSLANAAVVHDGAGLAGRLAELEAAYGPDIKWGVWAEAGDEAARAALEAAGLVLDSSPVIQGAALGDIVGLDGPVEAERVAADVLAAVNDDAYGAPAGTFARAFGAMPPDEFHAWGVRAGDEVCAVAAWVADGGDAHVTMVATRPHARRRGLGSRAVRAVLREARELGCTTTTLEASRAGAGVYRALGYRDVGQMLLYERRLG